MLDYILIGFLGYLVISEIITISLHVVELATRLPKPGKDIPTVLKYYTWSRSFISLCIAGVMAYIYFQGYLAALSILLIFSFVYGCQMVAWLLIEKKYSGWRPHP